MPDLGSVSNLVQVQMKKAPLAASHKVPTRKRLSTKASGNGAMSVSSKAVVARLVARHELTELEASWLLKAWEVGRVARTRQRFACYLAGFMAGIALKIVEQEVKSTQN